MLEINNRKIYRYLGAIHIHSTHSDGSGDIDKIVYAAKKAGLDFVVVTDHNNFDIEEGFYNGICVIKGEEISPYYCNHYLALGINKYIDFEQSPRNFVEEVRNQGGFGFVAHPDEGGGRNNNHKPIKWLDKNIEPDGVEIWNWFSSWADGYCDKNIFKIAYAYLFRHNLIKKPVAETLKWWDDLNNKSDAIIPAIGGVDAHALKITDYVVPLTIFPYLEMFKTITNAVILDEKLSDDFSKAKQQILSSLQKGKNLIINRKIDKKIPEIYISSSKNTIFYGESVNFDNNLFINVMLKNMFDVKLIHNGIVIVNKKAKSLKFPIEQKGKYRVEVSIDNKGFAYSNPIVVK